MTPSFSKMIADFGGVDLAELPPVLRTLLISDGTVTKFLEAWCLEPVQVNTLFHGEVAAEEKCLVPLGIKSGEPLLRRLISMRGSDTGQVYGGAESFIRTEQLWPEVSDDLVQGRIGIGELMRDRRIETYREVVDFQINAAGAWAEELECAEESLLATRSYRIFVGGRPGLFISDCYVIDHFREM